MGSDNRDSHGGGFHRSRISNVPDPLHNQNQWLVAKITAKGKKIPLKPSKATAIEDGLAFEEAVHLANDPDRDSGVAERLYSHEPTVVGFMLSADDPFAFVDWDDVRDPELGDESIPSTVLTSVLGVNSYTEVSPSGAGLKTILRVNDRVPDLLTEHGYRGELGLDTVGNLEDPPHIEVYCERRYTTVTANVFTDPDSEQRFERITTGGSALRQIIEDYIAESTPDDGDSDSSCHEESAKPIERAVATDGQKDSKTGKQSTGLTSIGKRAVSRYRSTNRKRTHEQITGDWVEVTDTPTVEQIRATGCALDAGFRQLWDGNDSRYPTTSEADCALVSRLWYYADDPALVDRSFRRSQLYGIRVRRGELDTPKWDRLSYRQVTMSRTRDNDRHEGRYLDPHE